MFLDPKFTFPFFFFSLLDNQTSKIHSLNVQRKSNGKKPGKLT